MSAARPRTSGRHVVRFLRRHPIGLIVSLVLILILADLSRRADSPHSVGAAVEFDPDRLDFGTVWSSDDFVWEAPIRNVSGETINVELVTSCGCTLVEPKSFPLAPGEQRTLTFHLDLHYDVLATVGSGERGFAATIYADSGWTPTQRRRDAFKLAGRIRDAVRVATDVRYAGADRLVEGRAAAPRTLTVSALTPLAELRAESVSADFEVEVNRKSGTQHEWLLTVTPTELVPIGEFVGEVRLHPLTSAGEALPSVPIDIKGTREPDIIAVPSRLQFVTLVARALSNPSGGGPPPPETVTIWSRSGRAFLVEDVEAEGLLVEPPASDTAPRHQFVVRPTDQPGSSRHDVTFSIFVEGESRKLVLPVSVYESTAGPADLLVGR